MSSFFLSEENPKNFVGLALKMILREENNNTEKEHNYQEKVEAEILLRLKHESIISNEKDVSRKIRIEKFQKETIAGYTGIVIPAKKVEIDKSKILLDDLSSKIWNSFSYHVIRINSEIDSQTNERDMFSISIKMDIENEGIESAPLWRRILGLSGYYWDFQICPYFWGQDSAYQYFGENINTVYEMKTFFYIPISLYKSFDLINTFPGANTTPVGIFQYSKPLICNANGKKSTELEEIGKEPKLAIKWDFGMMDHKQMKIRIAQGENFSRFSMLFSLFSLFLTISFFFFFDEIYNWINPSLTYISFKILYVFLFSLGMITIYVLTAIKDCAYFEMKNPEEPAFHLTRLFFSISLSFISIFPLTFIISSVKSNLICDMGEIPVAGSLIILLVCSFVLIYRKTPWVETKKFKREYLLGILPIIGPLFMVITLLSLVSELDFSNIFSLWAYFSIISTLAIFKLQ